MFLEASTGIEPVYTDLQSAASPLRQLAPCGVDRRSNLGEGVSSAPVGAPYCGFLGACPERFNA